MTNKPFDPKFEEPIEGEIVESQTLDIVPVPLDVDRAVDIYRKMTDFVKRVMRPDIDFGVIPGTPKPSLYKPGAEKLQKFFNFSAVTELAEKKEQWEVPVNETSFPLFEFRYITTIRNSAGMIIATSDGEANSFETKWRWRTSSADKLPKRYNPELLDKIPGTESEPDFAINKRQTTGQYGHPEAYWDQWVADINSGVAHAIKRKKKDNTEMDAWERDATVYRIPNEDIYNQVNTMIKIAAKRSYVGAVIIAANASEYFTQDVEDFANKLDKDEPTIKLLVPDKDTMARKLIAHAASLGHKDAGMFIKELLEKEKIVWSLDNWSEIIDLVEKNS